jgi:hypothetical protein
LVAAKSCVANGSCSIKRLTTIALAVTLLTVPTAAEADGGRGGHGRHGQHHHRVRSHAFVGSFLETGFDGQSFLLVDATPPEAQVFLDGRLLGSTAQLIAHAIRLTPGQHTVQIVGQGLKPYRTQILADPSFPTRIRAVLSRE